MSAISTAPQLCATNNVQGIIVPDARIEQSSDTGRSHATIRLDLLNCSGRVLRSAFAQADMGNGMIVNFGAAAVGVSERAMGPALDQMFPPSKAAATSPK